MARDMYGRGVAKTGKVYVAYKRKPNPKAKARAEKELQIRLNDKSYFFSLARQINRY